MDIKIVKKGQILGSPEDDPTGVATADGIEITLDPEEIERLKTGLFITNAQLVNTAQYGRWKSPIQLLTGGNWPLRYGLVTPEIAQ